MRCVLLLSILFLSPPHASDAPPEEAVILFEHATHDVKFPGWSFRLREGLCNTEIGFADDEASAIFIPPGHHVILYDGLFPDGPGLSLGPGMHDLADFDFNDRMSSIEVRPRPIQVDPLRLFGAVLVGAEEPEAWSCDLDDGGETFLFAPDHFRDDVVRSVEIPRGYEAILLENGAQVGPALIVREGRHDLVALGFADRLSAIRAYRRRWE